MKSLNKVFIGMAALVLLTGCGGTKVSKDKFQEKVDALEAHEYSEATVKYDVNMTGTIEEKGKGEVKFTKKDGVWTTDDTKHASLSFYLTSIKGQKMQDNSEKDGIKTTYTYYVNPMKIVSTQKGESKDGDDYIKVDSSSTVVMDKYGYPTSISSKTNYEAKVTIGVTVTTSSKGTEKYTISYK